MIQTGDAANYEPQDAYERLSSPEVIAQDGDLELSLRPKELKDYIGQEQVKENLEEAKMMLDDDDDEIFNELFKDEIEVKNTENNDTSDFDILASDDESNVEDVPEETSHSTDIDSDVTNISPSTSFEDAIEEDSTESNGATDFDILASDEDESTTEATDEETPLSTAVDSKEANTSPSNLFEDDEEDDDEFFDQLFADTTEDDSTESNDASAFDIFDSDEDESTSEAIDEETSLSTAVDSEEENTSSSTLFEDNANESVTDTTDADFEEDNTSDSSPMNKEDVDGSIEKDSSNSTDNEDVTESIQDTIVADVEVVKSDSPDIMFKSNSTSNQSSVSNSVFEDLFYEYDLTEDKYYGFSSVKTFPYLKSSDGLYYYYLRSKKSGIDNYTYHMTFLCDYFKITKYYKDINGNFFVDITINKVSGEITVKDIPASYFSVKLAHNLVSKGLSFNHLYTQQFGCLCISLLHQTPLTQKDTKIGWHEEEGEPGVFDFKGYDKDIYCGNVVLKQKGSYEEQLIGLNRVIKDSIGCQLAVAIGLSSSVLGFINKVKGEPIFSPIFHIYGSSSKGKSTALSLASSLWGSPKIGEGIMRSWNATHNGLMQSAINNNGVIIPLDELILIKEYISKFVYSFSQGVDKIRYSFESSEPKPNSWCTAILSSGEKSLDTVLEKYEGVSARVVQFYNLTITNSAEHANEIAKTCYENYGHVGQVFVDFIIKQHKYVYERYLALKEEITDEIKNISSLSARLSQYFAIITLSAEIASSLGLETNSDGIKELLITNHKKTVYTLPTVDNQFFAIQNYITSNIFKFIPDSNPNILWGKYDRDDKTVLFIKDKFESFVRGNGWEPKNVVDNFKAAGILISENDRTTIRRSIFGIKTTCYCINLAKGEELWGNKT